MIGIFLFYNPQIVIKLLPVLLGTFVLVDSVWVLKGSLRLKKAGRGEWKILLIGSLIFIGFGIAMVINPFTMIKYTVIFAGCVMLANGVVDFVFLVLIRRGMKKAEEAVEEAPFFLPAVLFLTEKAALFSEKLFCHRKLLIAGLFTFTVCVNLQMPVKLFSLTNIPKISQTADNMADIYHKYYSDRKTVLTVNNKSMFYNKFNVIPEDKFFYIPAISYQTFPDAVNAQVQSGI